MYPRTDAQSGFKYPAERLLELRDIFTEDRMRHSDTKDHNGENCFYVIKHGLTTLTTIGRATGFFSHACEYFANQTHRDSIKWATLPYDNDSGALSKGGGSGSIIASGTGEVGGSLLAGLAGPSYRISLMPRRCSGSGSSSRPSSPMPTSTRSSTRFVSFRLIYPFSMKLYSTSHNSSSSSAEHRG
jgi:hypothetical protein